VNDTWLEFTGRSFEDEIGEGFAETFHPDFRENVIRTYHEAFAARCSSSVEFPMLRFDGVYRAMQASGRPRFLPDGTFVGYVGCFVDVTDQKTAALEAEKYKAAAAAIAQAKGIAWQLLDVPGDPPEAPCHFAEPALRDAVATHKLQAAGEWTYTPVLVGGKLVAIAATRP
jgi:PAS domain S-box-containing protein